MRLRSAKAAPARLQCLEKLANSISRSESVLRVFLRSAKAAPARFQYLEKLASSISWSESVLRVFLRRSVIILAVSSFSSAWAHDVITTKLTWTREISRIVRKNCASCHREGGSAPMSLATYEETRPWAVAIREEVLARRMPPWPAVQGYGSFQHELALSGQEISNLANWVEGGAPEGEPQYLPSHAHVQTPSKSGAVSGRPIAVRDGFRLLQNSRITAIQVVPQDRQVKLRAVLPNGAVELLIWLQPNKAGKRTTLTYQTPLLLPAGTMIETEPAQAGMFTLISSPPRAR